MMIQQDQQWEKYLEREIGVLRAITHPNVLKFVGLCYYEDSVLLVTEYIGGGTLRSLIKKTSIELPWLKRISLATDTIYGIAHLHSRNIIHRDIKSKNLLLTLDGHVKICDFGFARIAETEMRLMSMCGTDSFMAPEIILGMEYNSAADIFSFGIVLCELITRKKPNQETFSRTPRNFFMLDFDELRALAPPDTPEEFLALAMDCCAYEPHLRPTALDVGRRLRQLREELVELEQIAMQSAPANTIQPIRSSSPSLSPPGSSLVATPPPPVNVVPASPSSGKPPPHPTTPSTPTGGLTGSPATPMTAFRIPGPGRDSLGPATPTGPKSPLTSRRTVSFSSPKGLRPLGRQSSGGALDAPVPAPVSKAVPNERESLRCVLCQSPFSPTRTLSVTMPAATPPADGSVKNAQVDDPQKYPRVLSCFHTFCTACLNSLVKPMDLIERDAGAAPEAVALAPTQVQTLNGLVVDASAHHAIVCPRCSEVTVLDNSSSASASLLPINFLLDHRMQQQQLLQCASSVLCEECDPEFATATTERCLDCSLFMCAGHKRCHQLSRHTKSHRFVSLSDIRDADAFLSPILCSQHAGQQLLFFCTDCHLPICPECAQTTHQQHQSLFMSDAKEKYTPSLQQLVQTTQQRTDLLEELVESSAKLIEAMNGTVVSALATMRENFAVYYRLLQEREQRLIGLSDDAIKAAIQNLAQPTLLASLAENKRVAEFARKALRDATDSDLLSLSDVLVRRLTDCVSQQHKPSLQLGAASKAICAPVLSLSFVATHQDHTANVGVMEVDTQQLDQHSRIIHDRHDVFEAIRRTREEMFEALRRKAVEAKPPAGARSASHSAHTESLQSDAGDQPVSETPERPRAASFRMMMVPGTPQADRAISYLQFQREKVVARKLAREELEQETKTPRKRSQSQAIERTRAVAD
eukprot:TRINITY_DN4094_c0_g1_i1.p1 TRINITY_DN4094_c0_g1~~TRINITY_DN4094_c0_g1_i1.p1  ORF type:complete len:966 (+),score=170.46 TRINITY_DN4094_c0_g1_i1:125-2899(+)